MQTLEDLIYNRLTKCADLPPLLAVYDDIPAVFYQNAPDDTATGWKKRPQYPRLDYVVDFRANPERKTSGVLTLNIWSAEDGTPPEEIEPIVRDLLCGVFLTPEDSPPFALSWSASEAFEKLNGDNLVVGVTIYFDVYAFPSQISTDPDPILAMNAFVRDLCGDVVVIGSSDIPAVLTPTPEKPVFYFRLETSQVNRETNTVVWLDAVLAGHCFAGGEEIPWLRVLADALALDGEVAMLDKSPMFITNIKADTTFDALSSGQLRIYVRFGLLRRKPYVHNLWVVNKKIISKEDN